MNYARRRPVLKTRRTLDVLLMFAMVWAFVWMWKGAA